MQLFFFFHKNIKKVLLKFLAIRDIIYKWHFLFVNVQTNLYICVCGGIWVCMYVYKPVWVSTGVCWCRYMIMCRCRCIYKHTSVFWWMCVYVHVYMCLYVNVCVCVWTHVWMHVYLCVCTSHACVCMYLCVNSFLNKNLV